jgi:hypothetical protein
LALRSLSSDSASQSHVLWLDGDSLGMQGAQIGVFQQGDQVSFRSFLEGEDSGSLESEITLEVLRDFSD